MLNHTLKSDVRWTDACVPDRRASIDTGRFRFMNRVGFVSFRKASPCTMPLKLAARGRDSACPVYAWGFWAPSHVSANFNQCGRGRDSV